jgi:hypothetical protein
MLKRDYRKLYLIQDKFLSKWITWGLPFYLTGGTALGRFYLNHRFSEYLGFFVNADPDFPKYIQKINLLLKKEFVANLSDSLITDNFARFFVQIDTDTLKVEFVNDVPALAGDFCLWKEIKIDSVINILANKITTLAGRSEPKDIYDIVSISKNYQFNCKSIFELAKDKALINEIDIERKIYSFPPALLEGIDWLIPGSKEPNFSSDIKRIADDFILGTDNNLGKSKTKIEHATLQINNIYGSV